MKTYITYITKNFTAGLKIVKDTPLDDIKLNINSILGINKDNLVEVNYE